MILNEIKKFLFFPLCICSDRPACVTVLNPDSEFPRHFGPDEQGTKDRHIAFYQVSLTEENTMPRLLERLYNSKRMLVVVVYLSMFLDNILLTVVGEYYKFKPDLTLTFKNLRS
jgi:hypothetical protein